VIDLPSALSLVAPGFALEMAAKRHGPTFVLETPLGPELCVSTPSAVHEVFSRDERYLGGRANQAIAAMVGPGSTSSLDGEAHRERRRLASAVLSPDAASSWAIDLTRALAAALRARRGRTFRLQPLVRELVFDALAPVVLGPSIPAALLAPLRARVFRMGEAAALPLSQIAVAPSLAAFSARWLGALDVRSPLRRILRDVPTTTAPSLRASFERAGLDEATVVDELVTYLGAGYDTTASAIASMMHLVARHPGLLASLRALDAASHARLVTSIVHESLRLRPVLPRVSRVTSEPGLLDGIPLAEGMRVGVALHLLHRHAEAYAEPHRFVPDRFVDARPPRGSFAPFGGGARRCPGAAFATAAMEGALTAFVEEEGPVRVGRVAPIVARGSTAAPLGGVRVRIG
jgi:cytochrome P450